MCETVTSYFSVMDLAVSISNMSWRFCFDCVSFCLQTDAIFRRCCLFISLDANFNYVIL